MSYRRDVIEGGGLIAVVLTLFGGWLLVLGQPIETEYHEIEETAAYGAYADRDPSAPGAPSSTAQYHQVDLGRMVVRQDSRVATTYWAIQFNVWIGDPVPPDGPEVSTIRTAVFSALAAVMQDAPDTALSLPEIKRLVAAKVTKNHPNVHKLIVQEARRSEVGRT